jgi:hypothetical protein
MVHNLSSPHMTLPFLILTFSDATKFGLLRRIVIKHPSSFLLPNLLPEKMKLLGVGISLADMVLYQY